MKDDITKEDLRKALIGISINEANKQKFRNAEQIKKAIAEHSPRVLNNLIGFENILNARIERLRNGQLNEEEEFILNFELDKGIDTLKKDGSNIEEINELLEV